jgi:hypothetical protein
MVARENAEHLCLVPEHIVGRGHLPHFSDAIQHAFTFTLSRACAPDLLLHAWLFLLYCLNCPSSRGQMQVHNCINVGRRLSKNRVSHFFSTTKVARVDTIGVSICGAVRGREGHICFAAAWEARVGILRPEHEPTLALVRVLEVPVRL